MMNANVLRVRPVQRPRKSKSGQTLVEYSLVLAFVAAVAIGTMVSLGGQVKSVFTSVTSQLASSSGTASSPSGGPGGRGGG